MSLIGVIAFSACSSPERTVPATAVPPTAVSTAPVSTTPEATSITAAVTTAAVTTTVPSPVSTEVATTVAAFPASTQPAVAVPLTFVALDAAGPATFAALADGSVDMAAVYGTQSSLVGADVVVLTDDLDIQLSQRLVPVVRNGLVSAEARTVLALVSSRLTSPELAALNRSVTIDRARSEDVAAQWLAQQRLDRGAPTLSGALRVMTSGSAETDVVARLYAGALRSRGMAVEVVPSLGARELVLPALEAGTIDMTVEYLGAYLTYLGVEAKGPAEDLITSLRAVASPRALSVLEPTEADDTNVVAVRAAVARRLALRSLSDLARVTEPLRFGGPPDCPQRFECLGGLVQLYGVQIAVPTPTGTTVLTASTTTAPTTATSRAAK